MSTSLQLSAVADGPRDALHHVRRAVHNELGARCIVAMVVGVDAGHHGTCRARRAVAKFFTKSRKVPQESALIHEEVICNYLQGQLRRTRPKYVAGSRPVSMGRFFLNLTVI